MAGGIAQPAPAPPPSRARTAPWRLESRSPSTAFRRVVVMDGEYRPGHREARRRRPPRSPPATRTRPGVTREVERQRQRQRQHPAAALRRAARATPAARAPPGPLPAAERLVLARRGHERGRAAEAECPERGVARSCSPCRLGEAHVDEEAAGIGRGVGPQQLDEAEPGDAQPEHAEQDARRRARRSGHSPNRASTSEVHRRSVRAVPRRARAGRPTRSTGRSRRCRRSTGRGPRAANGAGPSGAGRARLSWSPATPPGRARRRTS